ncbi:2-dehydropantoate 2-reductase [Paenibacillus sediminis]|uniref:2-dehydropantoate 2-reductase n=1 Tax=Paenibacillus sediminis TaxID=664909 RepID=A0ABS4GYZ0_9BACL|nr:2-dehydropantoate 2-reductase [Paenibacillus sediminis]
MKIHIVGAGSIGLLYSVKLMKAGVDVNLWTRSNLQAQKLRDEGLTLVDSGNRNLMHFEGSSLIVNSIEDLSKQSELQHHADYIFLMTKQKDINTSLLHVLGQMSDERTKLICFQNGVGHIELIRKELPYVSVYAAITTEGAKRIDDTTVMHAGHGDTWIGNPGSIVDETDKDLINELEKAGFSTYLSNDIDKMIYRKLIINAVINPLTALWRIPNGELLATSERIHLMRRLYDEGIGVLRARGIQLDNQLWNQIVQVCEDTSQNTSSMLKDVLQGVSTEIDWINGSIVKMAENIDMNVPTHDLIWQLIRCM